MTPEERFKSKINIEGTCWIWKGCKIWGGYGRFTVNNKKVLAHRYAYELYKGTIQEGLVVRHRCPGGPNRACVNPEHMLLGTVKDNQNDRFTDGTSNTGTNNGGSKLNEEQVREIRVKTLEGATTAELSKLYSVSESQIRKIVTYKYWKHIS